MEIKQQVKFVIFLSLCWLSLQLKICAALPDVSFTFNEIATNEAAQKLIGMEIKLSNGALLRINSVTLSLQARQAVFEIGVQARAANTLGMPVNLTLKGLVREAARAAEKLTLPVELTEVSLANGVLTPLLKLFLGEWLTPERWSAAIPALEIPSTLNQMLDIPATTIEVGGSLPMTVNTQPLQVPLQLTLVRVSFAENHLALALQLPQSVNETQFDQFGTLADTGSAPFAMGLSRRALGTLLQAFANANNNDLTMRFKPARIRQEQIDALVRVTNYTDLESGEGQADLKQISLEQLRDNVLGARLLAQGSFNARVNGREYGIPYRLSPRGQFAIQDRGLNLRLASDGEHLWLQAVPGGQLPVDVRMNLLLAGHEIGVDRQISLPTERVFNRWELPALWARAFPLPRKLNVQADKSLQIAETHALTLSLSGLQVQTQNDMLMLTANMGFAIQ